MKRRVLFHTLLSAGFAVAANPPIANPPKFRIGLTPVILADQVAFLSRWGRYLSERMDCHVNFIARETYQSILELLSSGQIDAAWICGYPFVRFESELTLLNVPLYQGNSTYQAYLIRPKTNAVSGTVAIKDWGDLRGKVLAYSDPLSNSGWPVAQAQLALVGVAARDLKRSFFAHGHRNVAESVAARLAHAGSIDGYVWETMRQQNMSAANETEIVWKSEAFGFPPLVTKSKTTHPKREALQKTLMAMSGDEAGRGLLRALNLSGFTDGTPAMFDSIRRQARTVPDSGVYA